MLFLVRLMEAYEVFQMGLKTLGSIMEREKENSDLVSHGERSYLHFSDVPMRSEFEDKFLDHSAHKK